MASLSTPSIKVNQSTLAFFPFLDVGLARSHDFHHFSGVASKAAIAVLKDGVVVAALCMEDKQLLRVTIRSPREKNGEIDNSSRLCEMSWNMEHYRRDDPGGQQATGSPLQRRVGTRVGCVHECR